MRINEVASPVGDAEKLAALSQFLIGRAGDTDAKKIVSWPTFRSLAANMGISVTKQSLRSMMQRPPISNLIKDVTGQDSDNGSGDVVFAGSQEQPDTMSVDQARDTVNSMAKRAIDIK